MDDINAVLELKLMLSRRTSFNLDRGVPLEHGRNWTQDIDVICFTFLSDLKFVLRIIRMIIASSSLLSWARYR